MAAEPKRPPPPKSYVPLTLLDGPPALPPRPRTQNGSPSIHPHTPTSPTGDPIPMPHPPASSTGDPAPTKRSGQEERRSESPIPVKPARRKTKRGPAPPPPSSQPATMDGSTAENELKESMDSPGPRNDSTDSQPPIQQARRRTYSKTREKPPTPPPYAGQSPVMSRALSGRKEEEKESNHTPASTVDKFTSHSRPVPATPPPYAGQSPILSRRAGVLPSSDKEKEKKDVPASPTEKLTSRSHPVSPHPTEREGEKEGEGKRGGKGNRGKDREREKPPAPVRPADGQQPALAKSPAPKVNRPPPSRPSRPPAANTPPPEFLLSKDPSPKLRPRTVSASSPASSPKSGRSPNIHKRDAKPEITVVSVQPMSGDIVPPPSLSRRMTAPSRPLGNPRKHPGPPPPRKSPPPLRKSPPTPPRIESPDVTTSPAVQDNADQQTISPPGAERETVTRKSPPPPRKPPRELAKPEAEEAQKGKRPPPPRPGSRPPPSSQDKKAPPPATRPIHPPAIKKRQSVEQQQQQQQQEDELERKLQELGPPPTEEPPELPPEALEADLQELPTPQPRPPSSSKSTVSGATVPPTSPTPGTAHTPTLRSPLAPRKPPKRPTQPPPPKHTTNTKEVLKGQAEGDEAEKDKQVEVEKQVKPTAPAQKSLSAEPGSDVSENQSEKVVDTKQEALATKPVRRTQRPPPPKVAKHQDEGMRPAQRPPPPKVAKHREEGTEPPSKAQKEGVKPQEETNRSPEEKAAALPAALPERPPVKQKPSVPRMSSSPEVMSPESEEQEKLPQVDKTPVARKPSGPRATPPPSTDIVTSEGEKKEEVEKHDRPTRQPSPPPPEVKQEALTTKPTRPSQRPPPPKIEKHQDEGMRPAQRPPPPKVAKHREEGTEPPSKAQEEGVKPQEETNRPPEEKAAALPAALPERPPVKQKPSVPRMSSSPEVMSPESEEQEKLPQVDKPPVARKPSGPRATPPPSTDIVTSEGEKKEMEKPNKPQLTRKPSNKSPPPPEAKQDAPTTKAARPSQRPPPPKIVKHQDEGMRPAQRPPPPKVAKHREEGTEPPLKAAKHQEEGVKLQEETNQPPEEKPVLSAALPERPPVKLKPSVPRMSPSPEVMSPESEKEEKLPQIDKTPVARKSPGPRATPPPSTDIVTSEGEKKEAATRVEKPDKSQLTTKPSPPPPEVKQETLATKPARPFHKPPPPKVVKHQDEGMRPAQRPPPPKVAKNREEGTEPPAGKLQEESQVETNQPLEEKPTPPAAVQERPPVKQKPSVPRISPSPEVMSPESEKQEKLPRVDKPPVARKPSGPRATPPPSTDIVTSEGEKKEVEKPKLTRQPSPPPPEAKQEALTTKPTRPSQRPPPPKIGKHQDEGMRPAQRPPPPKVTKRPVEGTEPHLNAAKHQEESQVETSRPPEEKPALSAALQETQVEKPNKPWLTRKPSNKSPTPPEVTTPNQPQDDEVKKAEKPPPEKPPPVKRQSLLKKSLPPPETAIPKQPEDNKLKKPDKPPPAKRPSPLPKKSPPPTEVADPEVMEDDKQTQVKKRPPSVARRPISKKSLSPPEPATPADGKAEHVEKPEEPKAPPEKFSASTEPMGHEDEEQTEEAQPDNPETVVEVPERTSSGLPPKEQRKVERKEREDLKGGGEVEMVRVIRTSEGVTEQLVSSGGGSVDQVEREEQTDIDPTTTTVKLRDKPCRPAAGGDKNLEKTKRKPPRPMSMPPGHLPDPKLAQPSQKPARPPSLVMEKPGRPAPPSRPTPPSRPSQKPPAKKTYVPRKDSSAPPQLPPRPSPGHLLYRYVCSEPHGLALTVHDATTTDELSYQEGDVIELIERLDEHWFFARNADNNMMEGVVPGRDLKIIKRLPGQDTVAGFEEGPCAVATHIFQGEGFDELSFKEGDLIMLKTRVDDQWLRGKLVNGAEGIFPKSFVEIVEDLPESAVETPSQLTAAQATEEIRGPHCVALHPFTAESEGELSITSGDTIELLERVGTDWLKGRKGQAVGIFPSQFVEIKVDLPPPSKVKLDSSGGKSKDGNVVTAVYDFGGQDGELSFKTGDKIKVTAQVNEEWVRGEFGGQSGIFPTSFVDAVPPNLPSDEAPKTQSPASPSPSADTKSTAAKATGKCEALFDFTGENSGELSFSKGEVIIIKEWVNDDWLSGQVGDREGMFPASFVKVTQELPKAGKASAPTSKVTHIADDLMPKTVALYDYSAGSDQEISFKEGDVLYLLNRVGKKWYLGENTRTNQIGEFPTDFVDVVVPLP